LKGYECYRVACKHKINLSRKRWEQIPDAIIQMKPELRAAEWTNPADAETIDHAWWTVQRNSIVSPCRDVIDFADYKSRENYIRSKVRAQIGNPLSASIGVEFWKAPRSNGVCRLVSLPDVITRVTLQSLGLTLSRVLNSSLSDSVVSRPTPLQSTTFVDVWYNQWSQFFVRILRLKRKFRYLIVSDFANFFDSVNFDYLECRLRAVGVQKLHAEASCRLLKKCTFPQLGNNALGLPQLYDDTSLLLGNFYLRDFDTEVASRWGADRYVRWLDDIVVGAKTESEAWKLVAELSVVARDLGLNLNSHKTRLIPSAELDCNYLFLDEHKRLDSLEVEIALRQEYKASVRAEKAFTGIVHRVRNRMGSGMSEILLRRLYRLASLVDSPRLLPFVVTDLIAHPNSSSAITQYIASVSRDHQIASIVADYLGHPAKVYQTVEVGLLLSLLHRQWTANAKKQISKLSLGILRSHIPVISGVSSGIAALLLHRCAGQTKATNALLSLRTVLMAKSSPQAQRFAFTAICCALPLAKVKGILRTRTLMRSTHLQFLYTFLESRGFSIDGLIRKDGKEAD
jgi:hypothetical protein